MRALILAALLPEARAIARAFHLPPPVFPAPALPAAPVDAPVAVCLVGIHAQFLPALPSPKPLALIMAGLAGALHPDLALGDIVIQGSCPPLPDVRFGTLATSPTLLSTPAEKADLFRRTGALAVDMETQTAQRFAEAHGLPFLAVRAISDTASQSLDPALLSLVDPLGRPRLAPVFLRLTRHPSRLPELLRLRRAAQFALARLSSTLVALLQSGWPERT